VTVEDAVDGPNVVEITLRTDSPDVSVTVGVYLGTNVGTSVGGTVTHAGGDVVIVLNGDHLEVDRV
jgi:hypothetical protein